VAIEKTHQYKITKKKLKGIVKSGQKYFIRYEAGAS
jgi:hypothetical protein